jgi:hypothetical protein
MFRSMRRHVAALAGYSLLAVALTWPLVLNLGTHLTGEPSGDTGVYLWNLWVFHHEIDQWRLPFYTSSILSVATPTPVNLSLHNYTTFANLLAWPLTPLVGLVAAFNLIFLFNIVLSGYGLFLLARDLIERDAESWLAGALFAACPALIARGEGHFSLVAAGALPFFGLLLRRSVVTGKLRYAVGTGVAVAWATFSDAYYGVFCVMIGGVFLLAQFLTVAPSSDVAVPRVRGALRIVDVLLLTVGSFVAALLFRGGGPVVLLGLRISTRTLYTPMLVLSVLLAIRLWLMFRPRFSIRHELSTRLVARGVTVAVVTMAVLLSPVLFAFGERVLSGAADLPPTYWRSSPPGLDLAALVLPNPNHPLWGDWTRRLIEGWSGRADAIPEMVGSIPWIALLVLAAAYWRAGWRPAPTRVAFAGFFTLLALGPFVHVLGMNTALPTPWAILRYAPIVGMVRSPSRFVFVVMLSVSALFAIALTQLCGRYPTRRRAILAAVAALMAFELAPVPRRLHAAAIPSIYEMIAADPRPDIRVLELPFGVRDGASSIGDFSALSQYYQTAHQKAIAGGYLSRVSARRKLNTQGAPVMNALLTLSEHRPLDAEAEARARAGADRFIERARLAYVVIDHARASPELVTFASSLLGLRRIAGDGLRVLYVPCAPSAATGDTSP